MAVLLDLDKDRFVVFKRSSFDHGADRFGDTALLADDLSHIIFSHMELKNNRFRSFCF